ncbi:MAG: hypothetical protein ACJ8AS_09055 [Hyphomicrobiales bacterium]
MVRFEPQGMIQLAVVLNNVCHSLEKRAGQPVSRDMKELLANRILAAFDAGITDPEVLSADALTCAPVNAERR